MTAKERKITNIGASVRERLLNAAKKAGRDYNALLLQYFQERFLYRLSISAHKHHFILKGAFLFLSFDMPRTRPTRDIDMLGRNTSNDPQEIRKIIVDILNIEAKDGVHFLPDSVQVESITEANEYHGLRVRFTVTMDTIKRRMQLDLGFGDTVLPPPAWIDFPTLLDMPAPTVLAYHPENIIAEKFEAIVKRGAQNSRMKDFYDIYYLAMHLSFELEKLAAAIDSTFENRQTNAANRAAIFKIEFRTNALRQRQWESFLQRNSLETGLTFENVIDVLEIFVNPLFQIRRKKLFWSPEQMEWLESKWNS